MTSGCKTTSNAKQQRSEKEKMYYPPNIYADVQHCYITVYGSWRRVITYLIFQRKFLLVF